MEIQGPLNSSAAERGFSLLSKAKSGRDMTIRDDQIDYPWLLDAVRICRRNGGRFRLVDSGVIETSKLEWILKAGADLYTGDGNKREFADFDSLALACRDGKSMLAFLQRHSLGGGEEEGLGGSELINLGARGAFIHASNRHAQQDPEFLGQLALSCRQGGGRLICYHHGRIARNLLEPASSGAWIHLTSEGLSEEDDHGILLDIGKAARRAGGNIVFHLENAVHLQLLWDLLRAGNCVVFQSAGRDFKSPFQPVERMAREKEPDFRSFYLDLYTFP